MLTEIQKQLLEKILAADRNGALLVVDQWAERRSYSAAVSELLEPVIREFGKIWSSGEDISLAQGYIAGKIAEDIIKKTLSEFPSKEYPEKERKVVLGNIEDDYHELGRRLLGSFLKLDGWSVVDLGNDVLAEEFIDTAQAHDARIVGVSAMMYSNALNIIKVRKEIDRRNLTGHIQLAVGGAVFNENLLLIDEVGGDGTAKNAIEALPLFSDLWQRSLEKAP